MRDDDLSGRNDQLIDTVARELTRGEPSVRLRRRIRARIESSRAWSLPLWLPASAGGAVVVIVAVVIQWSGAPARLPAAPSIALGPTARALVVGPPPERIGRTRLERPERSERPARKIEIDPLRIEPIAMPPLAVTASSGEMPIEIDDLRIEPLQIQ